MHDGELPSDEALVARLVTAQFPELAGLAVRAWPSTGTVNAIFRLGDHLTARLPRLERFAAALLRELDVRTRAAIEAASGAIDAEAALAAWTRARGYALHQASLIVPYYADSHPAFAAEGARIVGEVLGDGG